MFLEEGVGGGLMTQCTQVSINSSRIGQLVTFRNNTETTGTNIMWNRHQGYSIWSTKDPLSPLNTSASSAAKQIQQCEHT